MCVFQRSPITKEARVIEIILPTRYLAERRVLDIGANAGFFSYWALQKRADKATAIDIDADYLRAMDQVKARLGF